MFQDKSISDTLELPFSLKEEEPLSPASSIMSNETDGGMTSTRGKGSRRGRMGGKAKTNYSRRSRRRTKSKLLVGTGENVWLILVKKASVL